LKKAIEIVDFSIKNGGSFHSYVSLPEGGLSTTTVYVLSKSSEVAPTIGADLFEKWLSRGPVGWSVALWTIKRAMENHHLL